MHREGSFYSSYMDIFCATKFCRPKDAWVSFYIYLNSLVPGQTWQKTTNHLAETTSGITVVRTELSKQTYFSRSLPPFSLILFVYPLLPNEPVILTKFHNFDVWHNILEGHLFIKNRFSKFSAVSSIIDLLSSQKGFIVPSNRWKLFSLNRSNGVSKNLAFHTDFKNVHVTLVKSAHKKVFNQKTILPIKK